jgi:hypothetical protein
MLAQALRVRFVTVRHSWDCYSRGPVINDAFLIGTYELKIIQQFPTLEEVSPSSSSSSYTIKTGLDVPMPNNNYLFGLAKVNNRGQVAPVASVCLQIRWK